MSNSLEQLTQSIFKKSLNDCNEEELLQFSKRFPYFGPAQFIYLKKLDRKSEAYQQQYQKAVLFYHEPAVFDQFIHPEDYQTTFKLAEVAVPKAEEQKPTEPSTETLTETKKEPITPSLSLAASPVSDSLITFEPYHTVDYFASQGIKLSMEESSKDKFGKQLKSFTEWLKTMKRLPATQKAQIQGPAEKQVESLAAHSVQSAEVVTEAMAEVWLHQGNKAKAIDIYRKLSLQNPSKSSYFAAKIELLNDTN